MGNAIQYLGYTPVFAPSATGTGDDVAVYEPHLRAGQLQLIGTTAIPEPSSE